MWFYGGVGRRVCLPQITRQQTNMTRPFSRETEAELLRAAEAYLAEPGPAEAGLIQPEAAWPEALRGPARQGWAATCLDAACLAVAGLLVLFVVLNLKISM